MRDTLLKLGFIWRCYAHVLSRGTARGSITYPKSALIIQPAQLGDMVCTTPMFRAIKRRYPDCRVTVVGKPVGKEVLAGNPDVDEYKVWSEDISRMAAEFKDGHYDFGCVTAPSFHAIASMFLGDVKVIAAPTVVGGWTPFETKAYRLISWLAVKKTHRMRHYVPREYLKLLEPLGIQTEDTKKFVYHTEAAGRKVGELLLKAGEPEILVGIVTGAGNKIKQWPPERFAKVADHLIERHKAKIVVIGGKDNLKESEEMLKDMKHRDEVLDTTATLPLDELKALVGKLDLMVSVDTGPVFFAEAQNIPTVDIAGNIDENEQAPNDGEYHLVVVPKERRGPVVMTMNPKVIDYEEAIRQIESITVEQVIETADRLIAKIKGK